LTDNPNRREVAPGRRRRSNGSGQRSSVYYVPLKSLSAADCLDAMEHLAADLDWIPDICADSELNEFQLLFETPAGTFSEIRVCEILESTKINIRTPFRRILERYVIINSDPLPAYALPPRTNANANNDMAGLVPFLGPMALSLGREDTDFLPLITRYGDCMSDEFDIFIPGTVFPSVIQKHGWGDQRVLDFAVWLILKNFCGYFDYCGHGRAGLWFDQGMGNAFRATVSAQEAARRIVDTLLAHPHWSNQENSVNAMILPELMRDLIEIDQRAGPYEVELVECIISCYRHKTARETTVASGNDYEM